METIFYLTGVLGLLCIIIGILMIAVKKKKSRGIFVLLLVGGILLEVYSIYIRDLIFVILQLIYIIVTVYGLMN